MSNTEREKIKDKVDHYVRYLYACDTPENTEQQVEQYNNAFMQLIDTYVEDQKREAMQTKVYLQENGKVWGIRIAIDTYVVYSDIASSEAEAYRKLEAEIARIQSQKQGEPTNETTI